MCLPKWIECFVILDGELFKSGQDSRISLLMECLSWSVCLGHLIAFSLEFLGILAKKSRDSALDAERPQVSADGFLSPKLKMPFSC